MEPILITTQWAHPYLVDKRVLMNDFRHDIMMAIHVINVFLPVGERFLPSRRF
jgi:hypothetical protein